MRALNKRNMFFMAEELYVNNIIITAIPFSSEKAELFTSYDNV